MWDPWIAKVEKDSEGTLKLQTFPGNALANIFNIYDRVVGGAVDIGIAVRKARSAENSPAPASSSCRRTSAAGTAPRHSGKSTRTD